MNKQQKHKLLNDIRNLKQKRNEFIMGNSKYISMEDMYMGRINELERLVTALDNDNKEKTKNLEILQNGFLRKLGGRIDKLIVRLRR